MWVGCEWRSTHDSPLWPHYSLRGALPAGELSTTDVMDEDVPVVNNGCCTDTFYDDQSRFHDQS
jgi:hypothetical protein